MHGKILDGKGKETAVRCEFRFMFYVLHFISYLNNFAKKKFLTAT